MHASYLIFSPALDATLRLAASAVPLPACTGYAP